MMEPEYKALIGPFSLLSLSSLWLWGRTPASLFPATYYPGSGCERAWEPVVNTGDLKLLSSPWLSWLGREACTWRAEFSPDVS